MVLATTDEITEPNGSIAAGNFAARASSGNVLLTSVNNRIATSGGITAGNGDVVLVDDPTLVLTGPYGGNNLFFEVNGAGDTLVRALQRLLAPRLLLVARQYDCRHGRPHFAGGRQYCGREQ